MILLRHYSCYSMPNSRTQAIFLPSTKICSFAQWIPISTIPVRCTILNVSKYIHKVVVLANMNWDLELLPVLNSKSLICFIMEIGVFVSFPMIFRQISHEVQERPLQYTHVFTELTWYGQKVWSFVMYSLWTSDMREILESVRCRLMESKANHY